MCLIGFFSYSLLVNFYPFVRKVDVDWSFVIAEMKIIFMIFLSVRLIEDSQTLVFVLSQNILLVRKS
jgi:hypothetical protein